MGKPPRENIVLMPLASVLGPMMVQIRQLAADSGQVFFSPHSRDQLAARGLTDLDALRVLRLGEISGLPWREEEIGGRACKVVFRPHGGRTIGVVTVIMDVNGLLVKTVEWEDRR